MQAIVRDGKLEEYIRMHNNIYPEVQQGLRDCGVMQLTIFKSNLPGVDGGTHICLYATTADGIDLGEVTGKGSAYRKSHKRVEEWETMMETEFHAGWVLMEEIHSSDTHWT